MTGGFTPERAGESDPKEPAGARAAFSPRAAPQKRTKPTSKTHLMMSRERGADQVTSDGQTTI